MTNFDHNEFIHRSVGQVPQQYAGEVSRLAQRYTRRDNEIVDALRRAGRALGATDADLDQAFVDAGLLAREPAVPMHDFRPDREPVNAARMAPPQEQAQGIDDGGLRETVRQLSRTVDSLVQAARRNGIEVG